MGHQVRRDSRKRHVWVLFLLKQLKGGAVRQQTPTTVRAVEVVFDHLNDAMVAKPAPVVHVLVNPVARFGHLVVDNAISREAIDQRRVNPALLQLVGAKAGLVEAIGALRQTHRVLRYAEVFRRHRHNAGAPLLLFADAEIHRVFRIVNVAKLGLQFDPVAMLLHRRGKLHDRLVFKLLLRLLVLLTPRLKHAGLDRDRVLDRAVEVQETGVLLEKYVLDVIRLLLRRLFVVLADRHERRNVFARENLDQIRHDHFDCVSHVRRTRRGTPRQRRHVIHHALDVLKRLLALAIQFVRAAAYGPRELVCYKGETVGIHQA